MKCHLWLYTAAAVAASCQAHQGENDGRQGLAAEAAETAEFGVATSDDGLDLGKAAAAKSAAAAAASKYTVSVKVPSYIASATDDAAIRALPTMFPFDFDADGVRDLVSINYAPPDQRANVHVVSGTGPVLVTVQLPVNDLNRNGVADVTECAAGTATQYGRYEIMRWLPQAIVATQRQSVILSIYNSVYKCPEKGGAWVGWQAAPQQFIYNGGAQPILRPLNVNVTGRHHTCTRYAGGSLCFMSGYNSDSKLVYIDAAGAATDVTTKVGLTTTSLKKFMIGATFADFNGDGVPDIMGAPQHSPAFLAMSQGALPVGGQTGATYKVSSQFGKDEYLSAYSPQLAGTGLNSNAPPCVYFGMEMSEATSPDFIGCYDRTAKTFYKPTLPAPSGFEYLMNHGVNVAFVDGYAKSSAQPNGEKFPVDGRLEFATQRVSIAYRDKLYVCMVIRGGNVGNPRGTTGDCAPSALPNPQLQWDLLEF